MNTNNISFSELQKFNFYAESKDDAFRRLSEVFEDMDVEIIKVEEA